MVRKERADILILNPKKRRRLMRVSVDGQMVREFNRYKLSFSLWGGHCRQDSVAWQFPIHPTQEYLLEGRLQNVSSVDALSLGHNMRQHWNLAQKLRRRWSPIRLPCRITDKRHPKSLKTQYIPSTEDILDWRILPHQTTIAEMMGRHVPQRN